MVGRKIRALYSERFEKVRLMSSKLDFKSPAVKQVVDEIGDVLRVDLDDYDGVIINIINRMEADDFAKALRASMDRWKQEV